MIKAKLMPAIGCVLACVLMLSVAELAEQPAPEPEVRHTLQAKPLPNYCAEVYMYRRGLRHYYSVVCYAGNDMWLNPIIPENAHPVYLARVDSVKAELKRKYDGR